MSVNTANNNRLIAVKSVLWFLIGAAMLIVAVRYVRGLGLTTALTDTTPWGMWIGFDVMAGVALAAGGFVLAATVYIFGRDRYHGIVRAAVLTAFLGYLGVIIGLMVDLGRPYNIWRMIVNHNLHSPLFEVGMCVMLYTTVLALEFAPVGLERFNWAQPTIKFLRKLILPLVIIGIALSSLHQSSLGTLFLLTEARMHPLWFSPVQSPLFLISAIALGLAMVTLEGVITSWLYRRKAEWPLFGGLTRAAAVVLSLYLILRLGDLGVRGLLGHAFDGSGFAVLFWLEIAMSAVIPILLFTLPDTRDQNWAIGWGALLVVSGFVLHRADVGGISHMAVTGEVYVPALTELVTSLGIVAGLALVFLFFVEKLKVWEEPPEAPDLYAPAAFDAVGQQFIRGPWFGGGQRAVLAIVFGAVVGLVIVEGQLNTRETLQPSEVNSPRNVLMARHANLDGSGYDLELITSGTDTPCDEPSGVRRALLIDSGSVDRFVLFEHDCHLLRLGGRESCAVCHHRNLPLDQATSCSYCHSDMYEVTDTFSHEMHEDVLGGRESCVSCHAEPDVAKDRASAKSCDECHRVASADETLIRVSAELDAGLAPGYKDALHGLCLDCHTAEDKARGAAEPYLGRCETCHRADFGNKSELIRRARETINTGFKQTAAVGMNP
ncbi:Ni/Fe-hydrogenase cytochrome b subunit [bacterium]|nr:Ni/Fe-hydrogenase cytochrome b subunit [bacterium]